MRRSIWFWLLIAVLVILILGVLFGGYRKGTPVGSGDHQVMVAVSVAPADTVATLPRVTVVPSELMLAGTPRPATLTRT